MGALRDCERVVGPLLGQPANTLSTLALAVAGGLVIRKTSSSWLGYALLATGLGSFLFHGPMPPLAEWAHDVTLAWLLLVVAGLGRPWERWTRLAGLVILGALFALWPGMGDPVGVALAVLAISLLLLEDRSRDTVGPVILLTAVAIIGRLGATGGPLCDPDSLLQPHALWHIGSATAVAWWALRRHPQSGPRRGTDRISTQGTR
ncbi:MAG: hypothetical protein PVJ28_02230 [Acidimicrobiia bacterium]